MYLFYSLRLYWMYIAQVLNPLVIADLFVLILIPSGLCDQPLKFRFTRDGCVIARTFDHPVV